MANPVKGEIEIDLPTLGKRTFRIGFNEVCVLEESLGRAMSEVFSKSIGFREIREVIFVGMRDASVTREDVGEALGQHGDLKTLGEAMRRSMELSMPHLFKAPPEVLSGEAAGPTKGKAKATTPASQSPASS